MLEGCFSFTVKPKITAQRQSPVYPSIWLQSLYSDLSEGMPPALDGVLLDSLLTCNLHPYRAQQIRAALRDCDGENACSDSVVDALGMGIGSLMFAFIGL